MLPILLLLAIGVTNLSQVLCQLVWLDGSSYEIAQLAVSTIPSERSERTAELLTTLNKLHENDYHGQYPFKGLDSEVSTSDNGLVTANVTGDVKGFWGKASQTMNLQVTGPVLTGTSEISNALATFANGAKRYDCCGKECTGSGCPTSCVQCGSYMDTTCPITPACG